MIGLLIAALGLGLAGLEPSGVLFATGEFLVPLGSLGGALAPIHPTS